MTTEATGIKEGHIGQSGLNAVRSPGKGVYLKHGLTEYQILTLFWVLSLPFLLSSSVCWGAQYKISGILTHKGAYTGNAAAYSYPFEVQVDDCRYDIRMMFTNDVDRPTYAEWTFDGARCLSFKNYDGWWTNHSGLDINPSARTQPKANGVATIQNGPIPAPERLYEPTLIWMTFASSCIFTNANLPSKLRPIWMMQYPGLWESELEFPVTLNLSEGSPSLPRDIVYFNDGKGRFLNPRSHEPDEQPYPHPYEHGFTNATLSVQFCSTNGLTLPSTATFIYYAANIKQGHSSNDLIANWRDEISVTAYQIPQSSVPEAPKLSRNTLIIDDRLHKIDPNFTGVRILATNGQWLYASSNALQAEADAFLKTRKPPLAAVHIQGIRIVGACIILSSGVAFFILHRKLKKKKVQS